MEPRGKAPCPVNRQRQQQHLHVHIADDVLRKLDVKAQDLFFDKLRSLGCLGAARGACRGLRDVVDGSLRETLLTVGPSKEIREKKKNDAVTAAAAPFSALSKLMLIRWPRCKVDLNWVLRDTDTDQANYYNTHTGTDTDSAGEEEGLSAREQVASLALEVSVRQRISRLTFSQQVAAGVRGIADLGDNNVALPEEVPAVVGALVPQLPALRELDLSGLPESYDYTRLYGTLAGCAPPQLERLVLPGLRALAGLEALGRAAAASAGDDKGSSSSSSSGVGSGCGGRGGGSNEGCGLACLVVREVVYQHREGVSGTQAAVLGEAQLAGAVARAICSLSHLRTLRELHLEGCRLQYGGHAAGPAGQAGNMDGPSFCALKVLVPNLPPSLQLLRLRECWVRWSRRSPCSLVDACVRYGTSNASGCVTSVEVAGLQAKSLGLLGKSCGDRFGLLPCLLLERQEQQQQRLQLRRELPLLTVNTEELHIGQGCASRLRGIQQCFARVRPMGHSWYVDAGASYEDVAMAVEVCGGPPEWLRLRLWPFGNDLGLRVAREGSKQQGRQQEEERQEQLRRQRHRQQRSVASGTAAVWLARALLGEGRRWQQQQQADDAAEEEGQQEEAPTVRQLAELALARLTGPAVERALLRGDAVSAWQDACSSRGVGRSCLTGCLRSCLRSSRSRNKTRNRRRRRLQRTAAAAGGG
ncbi:hypothetical protein Agub_g4486, partial [Astrephomene gubernaculifera]